MGSFGMGDKCLVFKHQLLYKFIALNTPHRSLSEIIRAIMKSLKGKGKIVIETWACYQVKNNQIQGLFLDTLAGQSS